MHRWWIDKGACRGEPLETFFPNTDVVTERAAELCGSAVRTTCLAYALEDRNACGIWAGTTERDRRELRRAVA